MVKHTQTIRRQQPTNCLSLFDYFVELALKRLLFLQPLTLSENGLRGRSFLRNILKFSTATFFKRICC